MQCETQILLRDHPIQRLKRRLLERERCRGERPRRFEIILGFTGGICTFRFARAEGMIALQQLLEKQAGTQGRKAEKLGITQPRLNDLLRGRIDNFSLEALVNLASRAGLKIRLRIGQAA